MIFSIYGKEPFTEYKESVFGVILVRIFHAFSRIRTENGEILRTSPYSVQMRENAGKMRTRITSNTDAFYVVFHSALMTGYSVAVRLQIAKESRLAIFPKFSWIFSKSLPKFLVGFPEIFRTATF